MGFKYVNDKGGTAVRGQQFIAGQADASGRLLGVATWRVLLIVVWRKGVSEAWKVCWFEFPPLPL